MGLRDETQVIKLGSMCFLHAEDPLELESDGCELNVLKVECLYVPWYNCTTSVWTFFSLISTVLMGFFIELQCVLFFF